MSINHYCTRCSLTLTALDGTSGQTVYCPDCKSLNRVPFPTDQRLGQEGLTVPRANFLTWYSGAEPPHQKLAYENANAHLVRVMELIDNREAMERQFAQNLQSSIPASGTPSPDTLGVEHTDLLQNAYTCVRLSQSSMTSKLRDHAQEIQKLFARREGSRRLAPRVFQRSFSEVELELVSRELIDICTCEDTLALFDQFENEAIRMLPPEGLPELIEDYRTQFAEHVAVIETNTPKIDIPDGGPQASHGGLPEEIALAVEAVELSVENLRVTLRRYQEFGIKYLVKQERTILGDEMGLGKTIEALGAMVHLEATESASRFLVVAPASVIYNWQHEIQDRTELTCHILHGKERDRNVANWNKDGGIGVTSFSTLWSLDLDFTEDIDLLIVDEAHKVKNQSAERSQLTEKLANCSKRVCLMTGTPLENHVSEFVNLIRICDTAIATELLSNSEQQTAEQPAEKFRDEIAPVYLRRNQADVLTELPESIEIEEWVDLNADDRKHYDDVKARWNIQDRRQAANGTTSSSTKMRRLAELIETYREEGRKVIVFSNFINTLDLAAAVAGEHFSIRGSVPAKKRMAICKQFNQSDGFQVLIGQIEACGVGLNLQSASAVILMEPQFKPTTEWQAIARAKRMGQTRKVMIHRLLAAQTVDEHLSNLVKDKAQSFDDYARESSVKEFSSAATDDTEIERNHQLLKREAQAQSPADPR